MPKKQANKKTAKQTARKPVKKGKPKSKLHPGKKECRNCSEVMPIHQRVCPGCGHFHEMKKKREDIMKSLNRITPIVIKSIIENDDFNEFVPWPFEHNIFRIGGVTPIISDEPMAEGNDDPNPRKLRRKNEQAIPIRKGNPLPNHNKSPSIFRQCDSFPAFEFTFVANPITCIASFNELFIFVESVEKRTNSLTVNENLTVKAYDLQPFHCYGVDYDGRSLLKFSQGTQGVFDEVEIEAHVMKAKAFCNLVALLTGKGTLMIFSLPLEKSTQEALKYRLESFTEIIEPAPDKIITFQFLRGTTAIIDSQPTVSIVVGTALGHISVYRVAGDEYCLQRFIPNAHREMVTCLAECPLNSRGEGVLFTSGCYDGTVTIWDLHEKHRPFTFEASNRKVWSVSWDPGAKFLLISRDQHFESSVIACFYSINKIETAVHLASHMEIRGIKNQKNRCFLSTDFRWNRVASLDPVQGLLKLLSLEELRGNSLKKKKQRKEDNAEKLYRLFVQEIEQQVLVEELSEESVQEGGENADEKKFPSYSDLCVQSLQTESWVYMSTFSGCLIRFKVGR